MDETKMKKAVIEIVNPIGLRTNKQAHIAARKHSSLSGLRVGLLDNNKPNADKFLDYASQSLLKRYPDITLVRKRKMSRTEAEFLPELIQGCDVVINAFAD
jgi:hypothetical protein